jgi:choline kinase
MQAVILAAGQGTRLRPLTDDRPKCLVEVQGKSLLRYQLEALSEVGMRECVIVVGHRAAQVRGAIGPRFAGMTVNYVENELFDSTNNIYSLWLARHEIREDMLLLEADVLFEPDLLTDLIEVPYRDVAVVDRFQPPMNGTVILAHGDRASAMVLKSGQPPGFDYRSALKTVNLYKLSHQTVREELMPAIGGYVAQGLTNHYYEMAMASAIAEGVMQLHVLRTGPRAWTEIDTVEDLMDAERMRFWPALVAGAGAEARLAQPRR